MDIPKSLESTAITRARTPTSFVGTPAVAVPGDAAVAELGDAAVAVPGDVAVAVPGDVEAFPRTGGVIRIFLFTGTVPGTW